MKAVIRSKVVLDTILSMPAPNGRPVYQLIPEIDTTELLKKAQRCADVTAQSQQLCRHNLWKERAFDRLAGTQAEKGLLTISVDEDSGVVDMSIESESNALGFQILTNIFRRVDSIYVEQAISNRRRAFEVLYAKADSIAYQIQRLERRLAATQDSRLATIGNSQRVEQDRMQRELRTLNLIYGETVKNSEIARFDLETATPVFVVVEDPSVYGKVVEPAVLKLVVLTVISTVLLLALLAYAYTKYLRA